VLRRAAIASAFLLCIAAPVDAQIPGTPLVATRNPRNRPEPLPTMSLESGAYHLASGWMLPAALRASVDIGTFGITGGAALLVSLEDGLDNGFGAGIGIGQDLWNHGATGFFSFAGRALVAASYTRIASEPAVDWIDVPITLALTHEYHPLEFTILPWIAPRAQLRFVSSEGESDTRVLSGGSFGIEFVKARCAPATECTFGWGARLGFELIDDVGGGPLEGGFSLAFVRKFF
jgi:hypothetical protein